MIKVIDLQNKYRDMIKEAVDRTSYTKVAAHNGLTEQTIRNAISTPHKLKLETLERIAFNSEFL